MTDMGSVNISHLKRFADGFEQKAINLFAKKKDIPDSLPASGGDASTVNGHTVEKDVPSNAKFTDTTYDVMQGATASVSGKKGLVPAPNNGKQDHVLKGDGTWGEMKEITDTEIDQIIAGTFK